MEKKYLLLLFKKVLYSMNIYTAGVYVTEAEVAQKEKEYQAKGYSTQCMDITENNHIYLLLVKKILNEDSSSHVQIPQLMLQMYGYGMKFQDALASLSQYKKNGFEGNLIHAHVLKNTNAKPSMVMTLAW